MTKNLKTIFMGTPELAIPTLEILFDKTDLQLVITQPDRKAGRGKKLSPPPIKTAAEKLGIKIWQPNTMKNEEQNEMLQDIDLFVVLAYGEILSQEILDLPKIDCINLHASLLPKHRGASPLQACLKAGDDETGVSVMKMVKALDAGPVYLQQKIPLNEKSTLPYLHDEIAKVSGLALNEYLTNYKNLNPVNQDSEKSTYCGKLTSKDGEIDFTKTAKEINRLIRAYTPVPSAWFAKDDKRIKIGSIEITNEKLPAGEIETTDKILIGTADHAIEIKKLQIPGKKMINSKDFLKGNTL